MRLYYELHQENRAYGIFVPSVENLQLCKSALRYWGDPAIFLDESWRVYHGHFNWLIIMSVRQFWDRENSTRSSFFASMADF